MFFTYVEIRNYFLQLFFQILAEIYDLEVVLRFLTFGEARWLDSKRVTILFPARQVKPGGVKKSRRDDNGFVRFNPQIIGAFHSISSVQLFGHVPVGRFVRENVCSIFSNLSVDVIDSTPEAVSSFVFYQFPIFHFCFNFVGRWYVDHNGG